MILHIKFDQDWQTGLRDIQVNIFSIVSLWGKNLTLHTPGHVTTKRIVRSGPKLISSAILQVCLSSKPPSLKKIRSKMKALSCPQHFLHYKSMGKNFNAQGQVTPKKRPTLPDIELVQDFMPVLITCNIEEDAIKNEVYGSFQLL